MISNTHTHIHTWHGKYLRFLLYSFLSFVITVVADGSSRATFVTLLVRVRHAGYWIAKKDIPTCPGECLSSFHLDRQTDRQTDTKQHILQGCFCPSHASIDTHRAGTNTPLSRTSRMIWVATICFLGGFNDCSVYMSIVVNGWVGGGGGGIEEVVLIEVLITKVVILM